MKVVNVNGERMIAMSYEDAALMHYATCALVYSRIEDETEAREELSTMKLDPDVISSDIEEKCREIYYFECKLNEARKLRDGLQDALDAFVGGAA